MEPPGPSSRRSIRRLPGDDSRGTRVFFHRQQTSGEEAHTPRPKSDTGFFRQALRLLGERLGPERAQAEQVLAMFRFGREVVPFVGIFLDVV